MMSVRATVLHLACILVALTAAPGSCRVRDSLSAEPIWKVQAVRLEGVHAFGRRELRQALKLAPKLFKRPAFSYRALRQDTMTIGQIYLNRGYLKTHARVTSLVFDSTRRRVAVGIAVDEGSPTMVSGVSVAGTPQPYPGAKTPDLLTRIDSRLSINGISADLQTIRNGLADAGFLDAKVSFALTLSTDSLSAGVAYTYTAGPRIRVDSISIAGLVKVRPRVARRELKFHRGDVLTRPKLRSSIGNLYATDLFSFASVSHDSLAHPASDDDSTRRIAVSVVEKKFFDAELSLGYQTYEQARGRAQLSYANFFGMGIKGSAAIHASFIEQGIEGSTTFPWVFGLPVDADITASFRHRNEVKRIGLDALFTELLSSLSLRLLPNMRTGLIYRLQSTNILKTQPPDSTKDNFTHSIAMNVLRDTRSDPFEPRRGTYASVSVEVAGLSSNSNRFVKPELDLRLFIPLGPLVLSSALRGGLLVPYGSHTEIPAQELFYLGGASVMRGFGEKLAGPIDTATGKPTGGTLYMAANVAELRFPIYKWLSGVAFVDAGNLRDVRSTSIKKFGAALGSGGFRWNAGMGVRVHLPIVIVGGDIGFKIDQRKTDKEIFAAHLSVGHAF